MYNWGHISTYIYKCTNLYSPWLTTCQVVWLGKPLTETTWELASSLPSKFIDDYEQGIVHEVRSNLSSASAGHNIYALSTQSKEQADSLIPSEPKKARSALSVDASNSGHGYVLTYTYYYGVGHDSYHNTECLKEAH